MKFSKKIIGLFLFLLFFGIISEKAEAAKIYFDPAEINVRAGDKIQARIFIDTREQMINAVEMKVNYPVDLLKFVQGFEKDSIVSLWVAPPKEKQSGEINFSGLIPGGFEGAKGLIGTLVFETAQKGSGKIEISDLVVLLNDKKGTKLNTVADEMKFSVGAVDDSQITSQMAPITDNEPPKDFKAEIVKIPELFDGQWSLIFETQDGISGINHYEIQETKSGKISTENWQKIEKGPYQLSDQKLRSYIHIKAFDESGNNREVVLPPKNSFNLALYSIIFILILFLIIFKFKK